MPSQARVARHAPTRAQSTTLTILKLCVIAGALDSLGDEGNKFARTTIMPQRFPVTKDPAVMSLISSSNVVATLFCMIMVVSARQRIGLAVFTVFGNAFSSVVQFALLFLKAGRARAEANTPPRLGLSCQPPPIGGGVHHACEGPR